MEYKTKAGQTVANMSQDEKQVVSWLAGYIEGLKDSADTKSYPLNSTGRTILDEIESVLMINLPTECEGKLYTKPYTFKPAGPCPEPPYKVTCQE